MASPSQPPNSDPYKVLGITLKPDGSFTRQQDSIPTSPATPQLTSDSQLTLSKDIPLNPTTATFLRLYRPVSPRTQNLPIIVYFHGGGFVIVSATSTLIHVTCSEISAQSSAIVVSVEYRLAPEHRLPAAYDDGVDAIQWLRDQALKTGVLNGRDEWLTEDVDFSKVYLMGTSAGGNLTYFAGLRALDLDLDPIKIVGLVLDQPFFGGVDRTESELRLDTDANTLSLALADLLWSLSLPLGSDRDHEYCNPFGDRHRSLNEKIKRLPKCLIRVNGEDPMVERQKKFAKLLEAFGVDVRRKFYEDGIHGVEAFDPTKAQRLYDDVKAFIWN